METVTIHKKENERSKKKTETDFDLAKQIKDGLEDVKHGRIKEWKGS